MHSGNETGHVMLPCTTCSPPFLCISRLIHSDSDSDHLRLSPNFPTAERTTVIMPRDVKAYLASKKSETSDLELAQEWAEIEELYSKRYLCGIISIRMMLQVLSVGHL